MTGVVGPYFDGEKLRWADALAAWRTLERALGSPEQVLFALDHDAPDAALQAEAALIAAARQAFGLRPFDGATGMGVSDLAAKRLAIDLISRSRGT